MIWHNLVKIVFNAKKQHKTAKLIINNLDKSVRDRLSSIEDGEIPTPTPHSVMTNDLSPEKQSISGTETSDELLFMASTKLFAGKRNFLFLRI